MTELWDPGKDPSYPGPVPVDALRREIRAHIAMQRVWVRWANEKRLMAPATELAAARDRVMKG